MFSFEHKTCDLGTYLPLCTLQSQHFSLLHTGQQSVPSMDEVIYSTDPLYSTQFPDRPEWYVVVLCKHSYKKGTPELGLKIFVQYVAPTPS